jgi:hypothetical protein
MSNPSAEELYTIVENISGGERVFGYLGPRGMRLAAAEVVSIPGDLIASLGAQSQQGGRRRKFDALERSLKALSLRINSRPAPVLWDPVDEVPKSIAIVGGVLGVVDPMYNESSSSGALVQY